MKHSKKTTTALQSRDYKILIFLWYWRVLSTNAIHFKFFTKNFKHSAYKRLNSLKNSKYIDLVYVGREDHYAWVLTKKGYEVISESLPPLRVEGFKSEYYSHDFILSAVHLGGWLNRIPKNCSIVSEQELKRFSKDSLPAWIPYSEYYRSDGFWKISKKEEETLISLEVETSRKALKRYERATDFYNFNPHVSHVIWIVQSKNFAESIKTRLENKSRRELSLHQFILLEDILKKNWSSPIKLGTLEGLTLRDLLREYSMNTPVKAREPIHDQFLLRTDVSQVKSDTYKPSDFIKKAD